MFDRTGRDFALINKRDAFLHPELCVPGRFWMKLPRTLVDKEDGQFEHAGTKVSVLESFTLHANRYGRDPNCALRRFVTSCNTSVTCWSVPRVQPLNYREHQEWVQLFSPFRWGPAGKVERNLHSPSPTIFNAHLVTTGDQNMHIHQLAIRQAMWFTFMLWPNLDRS